MSDTVRLTTDIIQRANRIARAAGYGKADAILGPGAYQRKWYAQVHMVDGKISKVS